MSCGDSTLWKYSYLSETLTPLVGLPEQGRGDVPGMGVVGLPVLHVVVVGGCEPVEERFRRRSGHVGIEAVLAVGAVAGVGAGGELGLRALGDDVDDAAGSDLAVEKRGGALDHLHAGDVGEVEDRGAVEAVAQDLDVAGGGADREAADGEVGVPLVEVVAAVGDTRRVARDVEDVHRLLVLDEGFGEGLDGERQIPDRRVEAGAGHGVRGAVAAVEMGGDIEGGDSHVHQLRDVHFGHVFRQARRRCGRRVRPPLHQAGPAATD